MKKSKHPLHIVTTKKIVSDQIFLFARYIDRGLVYCIVNGDEDDTNYKITLNSVCIRLHMIACLVYKRKDGISKLSEKAYKELLFEGFTESLEEVELIMKRIGFNPTQKMIGYVFKCLKSVEELVVHAIANPYEIIYTHELASIINYVIQKRGQVPRLEYKSIHSIFPTNYDLEEKWYWQGFEIASDKESINHEINVTICSRKMLKDIINNDFPGKTAVISFYDQSEEHSDCKGKVCDTYYVPVSDIDKDELNECGLTMETFLPDVQDLAKFIYDAYEEGLDIICQCEHGQSRSAGCAAAILEHFTQNGIVVFSDYRYYPNKLIFHKLVNALEIEKERRNNN